MEVREEKKTREKDALITGIKKMDFEISYHTEIIRNGLPKSGNCGCIRADR